MSGDTIKTLLVLAEHSQEEFMPVWTPQGWRPPKGFPRMELLCCPTEGGKTWRLSLPKLRAWLTKTAPISSRSAPIK